MVERKHNLPSHFTGFVGRTREVADIVSQLNDPACRLLTIVGPGGIGKSRLAVEVARLKQDDFQHGVYYVPLAPITDPAHITAAIIESTFLQIQDFNCEPQQKLLDYLQDKEMLLVLDNFEHVLAGVDIVDAILQAAPRVKLLVTSREALNLQFEWQRPIGGLAFPQNGDFDDLEHYSAVQLFLNRARQIQTDFPLDEASIIRICQQVDGMPLAIELAASWLKTLRPADIAEELARNVDILTTRSRDVSERHRSMRAVFDQSWRLLSDDERDIFRKLSIFQGSFTRDAALSVGGSSLHCLADLVDKSLITLNEQGRYSIHELLRQFGKQELEAAWQSEQVKDAHAAFYLDLLHRVEVDLKSDCQIETLDQIEMDFENIRAGWHWAIKRQLFQALYQAVESLNFYCDMRVRYREGEELLRLAWEAANPTQPLIACRLRLRHIRLIVMGNQQRNQDMQLLMEDIVHCRQTAEQLHNSADVAYSYYLEAVAHLAIAIHADIHLGYRVIPILEHSLELFQKLDDPFYVSEVLAWMGGWNSLLYSGERGLNILCQCYDLRDQIGDCNGVAWAAFNLGLSYFGVGDYEQSEQYTREALERMTKLRTIKGVVQVTHHLIVLMTLRGALEEARQLTEDTLRLTQHVRYQDGESLLLGVKSLLVCLIEGDYALAKQLSEQSKWEGMFQSYKTQSYQWGHLVSVCGLGDFEEARRSLSELFERHLIAPIPTTIILLVSAFIADSLGQPEKAVEYLGLALSTSDLAHGWMVRWTLFADLRRRLEAELDPDVFQAAEQRGRSLTLTDVLTQIVTVPPSVEVSQDALVDPLTDRELDVLRLLAEGLSNRDIADQLVLSVGTVKVHTRNIYSKLGVGSRTQAIVRGRELGLLA